MWLLRVEDGSIVMSVNAWPLVLLSQWSLLIHSDAAGECSIEDILKKGEINWIHGIVDCNGHIYMCKIFEYKKGWKGGRERGHTIYF